MSRKSRRVGNRGAQQFPAGVRGVEEIPRRVPGRSRKSQEVPGGSQWIPGFRCQDQKKLSRVLGAFRV